MLVVKGVKGGSSGCQSITPQRFGFGASLISRPNGELAFCEPWKALVLVGAREGSAWQEDADRVAELATALRLPEDGKGGEGGEGGDSGRPAASGAREEAEGAAEGTEGAEQKDGDRVANLAIAARLQVNGQQAAGSSMQPGGSAATSLLHELEAEGIIVLSASAGQLLHQQCTTMLLQEPRLTAEGFHKLWKKEPWRIAPAHVRQAATTIFDLSAVEQLLTYKFSNPLLAVWALTHSSFDPLKVHTSVAPNPQVAPALARWF